MNTNQFIRHYTRLILKESSDWEDKSNVGGKTLGAADAEARAKSDPSGLLKDLGIDADGEKLKPSEILEKAIDSDVLSDVFETPDVEDEGIIINLVINDEAWPTTAVGQRGSNGWRYLKAILDASATKKIIDISSSARLYYRRQINENEKKCRIIVSARA